MKITELLKEDTIIFDLKSTSKEGVIEELVNKLYESNRINDKEEFKIAIIEREKLSSTGFGDGIAIPHAKNKSVQVPAIAFGRSERGVEYESMDSNPVHLFFMIAAPEDGANLHLKTLSKLARKLIYKQFRDGLMNAKTVDELLNNISEIDE